MFVKSITQVTSELLLVLAGRHRKHFVSPLCTLRDEFPLLLCQLSKLRLQATQVKRSPVPQ